MEQPSFIGTNLPAQCFSFVTIRGGFIIISTTIIWYILNQNADKTLKVSPTPFSLASATE